MQYVSQLETKPQHMSMWRECGSCYKRRRNTLAKKIQHGKF